MKKKHSKLFTAVLLLPLFVIFGLAVGSHGVSAAPNKCGDTGTSIIDCEDVENKDTNGDGEINEADKGVENNGIWKLLLTIVNWLTVGVGIIVALGIVLGAIRYITSDGNASQTQQGMSMITNAILGLVLYIFMYAIINFLVPGGLFN